MVQVAEALSYLHDLPSPIIHGDIKGVNILVNDKNEASLTDFGLSRVQNISGFTTKTGSGTTRWQAYELLAPCEGDTIPRVTKATDVWAFAMTVVEVRTTSFILLPSRQAYANTYRSLVAVHPTLTSKLTLV